MHRRRHREPENIMPAPISYPNNIKRFFRVHLPGFWNRAKLEVLFHLQFGSFCVLLLSVQTPRTHCTSAVQGSVLHITAHTPKYTAGLVHFLQLALFKVDSMQLRSSSLGTGLRSPHSLSLPSYFGLHCSHLPEHAAPKRERVLRLDSKQIKYWICYWHLYFILRETERHDLGI